ncbi:BgTH12-01689 [Blumeria graminis f. sp. triticale]|uniref:Bgt-4112 n=3 Tax=Blumeria graminis TaxID=34373 RepID=A0A061HHZ3_BLUGR|nr:hypothetical protein BGT96224_4112 [Blumeria graminis f. sp. tritici 96224]CAD6501437.1 BgTH12-01689 [Blumeria graminis f. sp. triticale]VDB83931.1 Bgt-4112 [Blumeria graminis f. sp. tritici]
MANMAQAVCCFETLAASLEGRSPLSLREVEKLWTSYLATTSPDLIPADARSSADDEAPLFVTWNTISHVDSTDLTLRGCIGTFEAAPLAVSLPSYALTAALHDPRFPPIALIELEMISVCVTLLTNFEPCSHPLDWMIGIHGIRVQFMADGATWNACYLPDVAVEQGWDPEECVVSCMQKSGWNGDWLNWRDVKNLAVTRFQGTKASLSFENWQDWRKWVDEQPTQE